MIKFNGIWQLVRVTKEDKTKKGDTFVQFVAASNRGDESDFKLLSMYGNSADYFLRNLTKDNEGKYLSRKMYIEGHIRTYNDTQDITCTAEIKKEMIPAQIGLLKEDISVNAVTQIKVPRDVFEVSSFEFVDKPRDSSVSILVNNEVIDASNNKNTAIAGNKGGVSKDNSVREINNITNNFNSLDKEFTTFISDTF